jgi:hypothetical protein
MCVFLRTALDPGSSYDLSHISIYYKSANKPKSICHPYCKENFLSSIPEFVLTLSFQLSDATPVKETATATNLTLKLPIKMPVETLELQTTT